MLKKISSLLYSAVNLQLSQKSSLKDLTTPKTRDTSLHYLVKYGFLPRDDTQSAVMPQYVVCLSVRLSVCDVGGSGSHIGWNTSKIISKTAKIRKRWYYPSSHHL